MSVPSLINTTKSILSSATPPDAVSTIALMGSTAVKNSNLNRSGLSSHSTRDYNSHVESMSTPLLLCNDSNSQIISSIDSRQQQEPLSIASLASSLVNDNICHSPTQILNDMIANNTNQTVAEDPRTLQLALELSMVGLSEPLSSLSATSAQLQTLQHSNQNYQQLTQLRSNQIMSSDQQSSDFDINTLNVISAAVAAAAASVTGTHTNNLFNNSVSNIVSLNQFVNNNNSTASCFAPTLEDRSKKSQNMTECVPVPSSEHVAEIVGRQGCKIKALRAKTNTYIKTPVRNEEPVFVVTGRKEDVAKAKREILSAAEHFSLIRATRRPVLDNNMSNNNIVNGKNPPGPPTIPGQITIQVRVPYRVVGLVVGPKGATIKHIQHVTQTYIVTPSREKEPIFEVTGLPDNVQTARKQIEAHIALRTGNLTPTSPATLNMENDTTSLQAIGALNQILNEEVNADFMAAIYKNGIGSTFDNTENLKQETIDTYSSNQSARNMNFGVQNVNDGSNPICITGNHLIDSASQVNNFTFLQNLNMTNNDYASAAGVDTSCVPQTLVNQQLQLQQDFAINPINLNTNNYEKINIDENTILGTNGMTRSCSSASSTISSKSVNNSGSATVTSSGCGSGSSGSSNSSRPELLNIWKNLSDSLDTDEGIGDSPNIWTLPTTTIPLTESRCSPSTSISPTDSLLGEICSSNQGSSNIANNLSQRVHIAETQLSLGTTSRECLVCNTKKVTAALVPCGHNMFCMECAKRICSAGEGTCPICSLSVYHAIRILV